MEIGAYNIVERSARHDAFASTISIIEFLRRTWRDEPLPAREVTVTGLDTLLSSVPKPERMQVTRFIRETLQDAANMMVERRQTVQFVLRGQIDKGEGFEVRQQDGDYVDLTALFGTRLRQKANDWLFAPFWI